MTYIDFYFTDIGKKILEFEARYISDRVIGYNALSIGCGPGIIEEKVKMISGIDVLCTDMSREMITSYNHNLEKIICSAGSLPFKNETFSNIIFVTSLEFISDIEKSLNESYRVLKKNGKVIFLLLNQHSKYFIERYLKKDSYISRNIKHLDMNYIENRISQRFYISNKEYIISITDKDVLYQGDKKTSSIVALEGYKR